MTAEIQDTTGTQGMTTDKSAAVIRKEPVKLRHEIKYSINAFDDVILAERLKKIFHHDRHADSHGSYRVSSLYFDTPYDKALCEKLAGVRNREKFRIRYYNEDLSYIKLEKKYKKGNLCAKRSMSLTCDQVRSILRGEIDFLLEREEALACEFYSKIRGQLLSPKAMVSYEREAFLYEPGNVRITIDRNLSSELMTRGFPAERGRMADVSGGLRVLEIKFDEFLPDIVRMAVQVPSRRNVAFSKYAECRRFD